LSVRGRLHICVPVCYYSTAHAVLPHSYNYEANPMAHKFNSGIIVLKALSLKVMTVYRLPWKL